MIPSLLMLMIFLTTTALVAAIGSLIYDRYLRDRWEVNQRLATEFRTEESRAHKTPLFRDLRLLHAQTSPGQLGIWTRFVATVEQSGLNILPQRIVWIAVFLGLVTTAAAFMLSPFPLMILPAGLAGMACPFVYVEFKRQSRVQKLCRQLPGAFDQMKRAVRAGQTITGAMQLIATDMKDPIAEEFSICCQHQGLGLPFQVTLEDLARRTGVIELRMFAVALLVQRESGGNCVELLTNLSEVVRKRLHLAGRVRALTSEGRLQAMVLALLPIIAFIAIFFLKPDYAAVLINRPYLLGGVIVSEILGTLWIRKIVNVEY